MNAFRTNSTAWIIGITAAVGGALMVRLVSPALAPDHARLAAVISVAGHLLALIGLATICIGVSRRLKRENARDAAAAAGDSEAGETLVVPEITPPKRPEK
ncbi:hypothetical protein Ga0100231_008255 [Opitutaceae bacterium TAV4]|uniref:hypothetical protein n=1 Tax=Geminisphaera colitermitum TaxID=1148786 RepID=UPI0002EE6D66|nr:hypothetical protein [Geminisphaera colitermitum]RRJ94352.1 hypothetical protein Ga0100231_008255 [Opitutaceae bacterium TAV4]RRJ98442.1 hypothetical protein Ga0100230_008550 [Opitutaceae bacterium TAV3]